MSITNILNITQYNKIIQENESCILYCSLSYCRPCITIYPLYQKFAEDYKHKNIFLSKITFDLLENNEDIILKKNLDIKIFPIFILINNGNILEKTSNIKDIEYEINYI